MGVLVDSDITIDFLNNKDFALDLIKKTIKNNDLFISVISWSEIKYGFKKTKNISKSRHFQDFLKSFQIIIIPIDEKVAERYLDIKIDLEKRRIPLADFDLLIAATAIVNNLTLVTRNKKHFSRIKSLKLI